MKLIDSHAHLSSPDLWEDLPSILQRAETAGIVKIINICTNHETLEKGLALTTRYPWVYNSAATTPHDVEKEGESFFPLVEKCAKEGSLVAIGETGLDYHYTYSPKEMQQHFLKRYLHLALTCKLPVVIHCREAFSDFFKILDKEYIVNNQHAPGVLHCFTGTVEEAQEVMARGWYLSLSGIVTFKKSEELREVAKKVPLDRLLLETDAPYLAPQKQRGKRNEPAYMIETAALIAEIKGVSLDEVAAATEENAATLFGFSCL